MDKESNRDVLVIGTQQSVLCYDVFDNKDLFHKEVISLLCFCGFSDVRNAGVISASIRLNVLRLITRYCVLKKLKIQHYMHTNIGWGTINRGHSWQIDITTCPNILKQNQTRKFTPENFSQFALEWLTGAKGKQSFERESAFEHSGRVVVELLGSVPKDLHLAGPRGKLAPTFFESAFGVVPLCFRVPSLKTLFISP